MWNLVKVNWETQSMIGSITFYAHLLTDIGVCSVIQRRFLMSRLSSMGKALGSALGVEVG